MRTSGSPARIRLIYVVFNSFFNLLTQDDQIRCFQNVAAHLAEHGSFVIEGGCTLSFLDQLRAGQYVEAEGIAVDAVRFDLLRLDPSTQMLYENHVRVSHDGVTFNPVVQRYAWPSELDLMARIAGLRLHERWGGWNRQAFTATQRQRRLGLSTLISAPNSSPSCRRIGSHVRPGPERERRTAREQLHGQRVRAARHR